MRHVALGLIGTSLAMGVGACDARIIDPGPVSDESLDQALANAPIVNGMAITL